MTRSFGLNSTSALEAFGAAGRTAPPDAGTYRYRPVVSQNASELSDMLERVHGCQSRRPRASERPREQGKRA